MTLQQVMSKFESYDQVRAPYAALAALAKLAGDLPPTVQLKDLREIDAIDFLSERVLERIRASNHVRPSRPTAAVTPQAVRRSLSPYELKEGDPTGPVPSAAPQIEPLEPKGATPCGLDVPREDPLASLPYRQRQVLDRLMQGDGEKQVAKHLQISPHTVHVYVKQLYARTRVETRSELLAHWIPRVTLWQVANKPESSRVPDPTLTG